MSRHVEIIAHRGANREAPENTIPAFRRALEIGVDGIELDVQVTRDGIPVVHHDPVLESGSVIAALPAKELQAVSNVPQLADVLALVDGRCRVYVEVKAAAAVDAVVDLLRARRDWCAVHSFDHRIPLRARTMDPKLDAGILLVSYLVDVVAAMRASNARDVWQQADFIDAELVERVHDAAGRVIAWTVNDAVRARTLAALGVDGICTDTPTAISAGTTDQP